ncbi:MAG: alpha/beta hydrolase [Dysgonamonadaceae bacterium]|jgi:dienelactone hydrolase|nr:alpha/beta hydrolase [Dysgonamonadaceae bacterium]
MKRIFLLTVSLLLAVSSFSQDIEGSWNGVLNVGAKLPLVINISENEGIFSATMDSPAQGAKGIPVTTVSFENAKLTFSITNIGVQYEGIWRNDSIIGTFKQNGMTFPLNLSRTQATEESLTPTVRPQDPKPPYLYNSENIRFENKEAGITLAGTFTFPKEGKNFPVAVLVTGSGPQNRDEELFGHRPFLVLSDYLTRNGIAVLRYDDRGVAESGGNYQTATLEDFATDAAAAVNFLKTRKEINPKKIGIIGHSMGGTIAFMLAGEKNSDLAYIVSLAGMAISGDSLLRMQRYLLANAMGIPDEDIEKSQAFMDVVQNVVNKYPEDFILQNMDSIIAEITPDSLKGNETAKTSFQQVLKQMMAPEIKSIMNYDPSEVLQKIKCPVLALNGEKDLQVPADANLNRVKALVKSQVTIKKYPGLNHLFQHCTTGLPNEYGSIEETISPEVLSDIVTWIVLLNPLKGT